MTTIIKAAPMMHSPHPPGKILRDLYLAPMRVTIVEAGEGARRDQQASVRDHGRPRSHHGRYGHPARRGERQRGAD